MAKHSPKKSQPASWYSSAIEYASEPQPAHPAKSEPLRVTLGCMADAIEQPQIVPEWMARYANERAELLALMVAGACSEGKNYGDITLTRKLLVGKSENTLGSSSAGESEKSCGPSFAGALVSRKLAPSLDVALKMHFREAVELAQTIPDAFDWVAGVVEEERREAELEAEERKRKAEASNATYLLHVDSERAKLTATFNAEPEPAKPNATGAKPSGTEATTKVTWQQAANIMEGCRLNGEPFTSQDKFATRIGCAKATVNKAIHSTVELKEWAEKQATSTLNAVYGPTLKGIASTREADPADICEDDDTDAMMAYLLDQAGPDERAILNAKSPAERRALAKLAYRDPDSDEQAARYRRPKPKLIE